MTRSIAHFFNSLSIALHRMGEYFNGRDLGYFERKYRFKINKQLLQKWSDMIPKSKPKHIYAMDAAINDTMRFTTSTHKINLSNHNGTIAIYRMDCLAQFRNFPHGRYLPADTTLLRRYIKAVGKDDAIQKLKETDFLAKIKDYIPEVTREVQNILMTFGEHDLIIINHTKDFNAVLYENFIPDNDNYYIPKHTTTII